VISPNNEYKKTRQILNLVGLPVKSVIVLVAEQPHQKARRVFVLLNQRRHLLLHERPKAFVGVVDRADPGPVDRHAIAAHGVVQDRVDAVLLVDVFDPPRRDPEVLSDDVDTHLLQQAHLTFERLDDDFVRFAPEVVSVVLPDRHVSPVHPENHRGFAIDSKDVAVSVFVDLHDIGPRGLRRRRCR
jgi:hypothetical protein